MSKYNIVERKEKDASYRMQLRSELVDELYDRIMQKLILEKKYRDPHYSARQLARELDTNTRYVSAVVSLRYQDNYSTLVNDFRIREAAYMLIDKRWAEPLGAQGLSARPRLRREQGDEPKRELEREEGPFGA